MPQQTAKRPPHFHPTNGQKAFVQAGVDPPPDSGVTSDLPSGHICPACGRHSVCERILAQSMKQGRGIGGVNAMHEAELRRV